MTPDQVVQSLEAQSTFLRDQIASMPKDSPSRFVLEQTLSQYDVQLARVLEQYKKVGFVF